MAMLEPSPENLAQWLHYCRHSNRGVVFVACTESDYHCSVSNSLMSLHFSHLSVKPFFLTRAQLSLGGANFANLAHTAIDVVQGDFY